MLRQLSRSSQLMKQTLKILQRSKHVGTFHAFLMQRQVHTTHKQASLQSSLLGCRLTLDQVDQQKAIHRLHIPSPLHISCTRTRRTRRLAGVASRSQEAVGTSGVMAQPESGDGAVRPRGGESSPLSSLAPASPRPAASWLPIAASAAASLSGRYDPPCCGISCARLRGSRASARGRGRLSEISASGYP